MAGGRAKRLPLIRSLSIQVRPEAAEGCSVMLRRSSPGFGLSQSGEGPFFLVQAHLVPCCPHSLRVLNA